jgi:hypothetical protein
MVVRICSLGVCGMCISLFLYIKQGYKGWQKFTFRAKRFSLWKFRKLQKGGSFWQICYKKGVMDSITIARILGYVGLDGSSFTKHPDPAGAGPALRSSARDPKGSCRCQGSHSGR